VLNIVVPLAGLGSRFVKANYILPKPFIDVCGKPMIQHVVENLMPHEPHRFIFIARKEHEEYIKQYMSFATDVIYIDEVTEGAACTVLLAENFIDSYDSLIIANSDQIVRYNSSSKVLRALEFGPRYWQESNNIQDMINEARYNCLDGMIATFNANHSKWSYAKVDKYGFVSKVAEKRVISNDATVGIYYYKCGHDFIEGADNMMSKGIRVNNEFYVCPVFNEMIILKKRIGIYPIHTMFPMGTPEDLTNTIRMLK